VTVAADQPPYRQDWIDQGTRRLGLQVYPEPEGPAPAVVIWPAMGVPARFYRPFATELTGAGLAVIVADLRGTGASTPAPSWRSRYGYAELVDDVGLVREALKPRLDGRRVVLLGHSLGGQACLLHLAIAGGRDVAGLALVAVGLPYWRSYQDRRRRGVLAFTHSIHATSTLLRVWPGWGFGGRQSRGVIRDWAYTARTGRFPSLPGTNSEAAVATMDTPVLAVSFEHDQYTPASTMDHLVAKLRAAPVRREHYDSGADHFTWARSPGPVAARVAEFARTGH
jgi:predicted alpha/beta hydrolase